MSRREEIKLDSAEITAFPEAQRVVVCATIRARGWPHLMPLWHVVRDGQVWAWT